MTRCALTTPPGANIAAMEAVFLLWHRQDLDDEGMLLGVYSTRARAEARIATARGLPGFRRFPDDFVIDRYEIDKDHWTTGFVTISADGVEVDDPPPPDSTSRE